MNIKDLSPDLILYNGQIYTLDANNSLIQAVAVKDSRFLALGADVEINDLAGPNTQHLDLKEINHDQPC